MDRCRSRAGAVGLVAALALAASCSDGDAVPSADTADTPVAPVTAAPGGADTPDTDAPGSTATSTSGGADSPVPGAVPDSPPVGPSPTASTAAPISAATTTTTLPPDPPPPNDRFEGVRLTLDLVADLSSPTAAAWRDGDPAMYVSTQDGVVHRVDGDRVDTVLDLTAETAPLEPGSERGLLGLAFDPRDNRMFVDYTDLDQDTVVASFELVDGVADPASRRTVLQIEQPGLGHNGGRLVFDRDGHVLIGSGDGGGSNGRDAADTTKLLGVILRVLPASDGDGYSIPPDNPFADGVADRPEVWLRGFRNPWTFSLDDDTGDLWIGDVGNEQLEEIDHAPAGSAGANFGWPFFEGTRQRRSDAPDGLVPPVHVYPRSEGVAVMGGHVYRGTEIPELRGAYLFGDLGGPVWALGADGVTRLDLERVPTLVGWAEDPSGELYLLSLSDGVYRLRPA